LTTQFLCFKMSYRETMASILL